jgi:hypothetical protein
MSTPPNQNRPGVYRQMPKNRTPEMFIVSESRDEMHGSNKWEVRTNPNPPISDRLTQLLDVDRVERLVEAERSEHRLGRIALAAGGRPLERYDTEADPPSQGHWERAESKVLLTPRVARKLALFFGPDPSPALVVEIARMLRTEMGRDDR